MERDELAALVDAGMTIREMATHLSVSYSTVRYWLVRHDLSTPRARRLAASEPARRAGLDEAVVECPRGRRRYYCASGPCR